MTVVHWLKGPNAHRLSTAPRERRRRHNGGANKIWEFARRCLGVCGVGWGGVWCVVCVGWGVYATRLVAASSSAAAAGRFSPRTAPSAPLIILTPPFGRGGRFASGEAAAAGAPSPSASPSAFPASLLKAPPGLMVPEGLPCRDALPPPSRLKMPALLSAAAASSSAFFPCSGVGREA